MAFEPEMVRCPRCEHLLAQGGDCAVCARHALDLAEEFLAEPDPELPWQPAEEMGGS